MSTTMSCEVQGCGRQDAGRVVIQIPELGGGVVTAQTSRQMCRAHARQQSISGLLGRRAEGFLRLHLESLGITHAKLLQASCDLG